MARLEPRNRDEVPELADVFAVAEAGMGFVPNSMLTMATALEADPAGFAGQALAALDWQPGKHA